MNILSHLLMIDGWGLWKNSTQERWSAECLWRPKGWWRRDREKPHRCSGPQAVPSRGTIHWGGKTPGEMCPGMQVQAPAESASRAGELQVKSEFHSRKLLLPNYTTQTGLVSNKLTSSHMRVAWQGKHDILWIQICIIHYITCFSSHCFIIYEILHSNQILENLWKSHEIWQTIKRGKSGTQFRDGTGFEMISYWKNISIFNDISQKYSKHAQISLAGRYKNKIVQINMLTLKKKLSVRKNILLG